jgi:hypothetical protein
MVRAGLIHQPGPVVRNDAEEAFFRSLFNRA